MSDLTDIAHQAERDLNSYQKKQGAGNQSLSTTESGVNENVEKDFPGADVRYGEKANFGGSSSRKIPPEEGGEIDARGRYVNTQTFLLFEQNTNI
ncbi:conserved hypothetical protein [Talaromyces stipitatus ATCC 10500]|uniref:Uncharacterized protein n=1 Tax=Talaromyces stipitatus (strain ATCC 10500 / CBS 375.48 / QM 6759 / NRRL 1006) TaxID=441959 RepID=B8MFD5_TALSN|nr:uncharacterized protein TSTA_017440 [Talaromyces stipitatus ATCC 10500]EED16669.1 conserved hypothetical protein [Talaromyces stipitatus ATCC 10500]